MDSNKYNLKGTQFYIDILILNDQQDLTQNSVERVNDLYFVLKFNSYITE